MPEPPDLYRKLLVTVSETGVSTNSFIEDKVQELVDAVTDALDQEAAGAAAESEVADE